MNVNGIVNGLVSGSGKEVTNKKDSEAQLNFGEVLSEMGWLSQQSAQFGIAKPSLENLFVALDRSQIDVEFKTREYNEPELKSPLKEKDNLTDERSDSKLRAEEKNQQQTAIQKDRDAANSSSDLIKKEKPVSGAENKIVATPADSDTPVQLEKVNNAGKAPMVNVDKSILQQIGQMKEHKASISQDEISPVNATAESIQKKTGKQSGVLHDKILQQANVISIKGQVTAPAIARQIDPMVQTIAINNAKSSLMTLQNASEQLNDDIVETDVETIATGEVFGTDKSRISGMFQALGQLSNGSKSAVVSANAQAGDKTGLTNQLNKPDTIQQLNNNGLMGRGVDKGQFARELQQASQSQGKLPTKMIANEMIRHVKPGESRFQMRLDPPELGRIEVKMYMREDGQVRAHMIVDKVQTLDLMLRDQHTLERTLEQAGLKTDQGSLQFSLRDEKNQGFEQSQQNGERLASDIDEQSEFVDNEQLESQISQPLYGSNISDGLDVRV